MTTQVNPLGPAEIQPLGDAELRREIAEAERFFEARYSENTRVAYARGWKAYTAWCSNRALDALNADSGQVCAFLAAEAAPVTDGGGNLVRPGRKVNTLELRVAAIKHHLREAGLVLDAVDDRIRGVLRGMRRELPADQVKSQSVAALTVEPIERVIASLDLTRDLDLRDRALLLVMFAGLLRRSEAGLIRIETMKWATGGVALWLPQCKSAPPGEGKVKRIPRIQVPGQDRHGNPILVPSRLCPVAAIEGWLRAAGLREGALFPGRTLTRVWSTDGLSGGQIARIVKARAAAAGVDVLHETEPTGRVKVSRLRFSGHSLRRGAATSADAADVGLLQLMKAGDWKDPRSTARYIDEPDRFERTPAAKILTRHAK